MKLKNLLGEDWFNKLSPFINSTEFIQIGKELQRRKKEGININPDIDNIFNYFKWCPYKDLKVVFLFDDLTLNNEKQKYFWNTIENEIYNGLNLDLETSLKRLSNQGVLFLNRSLTEKDAELWKPFYKFVFNTIKEYNSGIIFVGEFKSVMNDGLFNDWASSGNLFLPCPEPFNENSFSEEWKTGGIFLMINDYLQKINNTKIEW